MTNGLMVRAGMRESFVSRGLPDYCSEPGARELIGKLLTYWMRNGGVLPKFRLERIAVPNDSRDAVDGSRMWCVRSDMVRGVPRDTTY